MKILIIEDDKKVAQALKKGLESEHYDVEVAYAGEEGFFLVNSQKFDMVLLDLMLPGRDGLEILMALRRRQDKTPVLILTAKDAVEDRVIGVILFSVSVHFFVKGRLFQQLNEQLDKDYSIIAAEVSEEPADLRDSEPESSTKLFRLVKGKSVYYQSRLYEKAGLPEILDMPASKSLIVRSESENRFRLLAGMTKTGFLLVVAQGEEPARTALHTLFVTLVLALPSALILTALGGYIMATRLLRPVASMANKAGQISAENLSERLPVENPGDELGKLAMVLNQTLSRLENAFERLLLLTRADSGRSTGKNIRPVLSNRNGPVSGFGRSGIGAGHCQVGRGSERRPHRPRGQRTPGQHIPDRPAKMNYGRALGMIKYRKGGSYESQRDFGHFGRAFFYLCHELQREGERSGPR